MIKKLHNSVNQVNRIHLDNFLKSQNNIDDKKNHLIHFNR